MGIGVGYVVEVYVTYYVHGYARCAPFLSRSSLLANGISPIEDELARSEKRKIG